MDRFFLKVGDILPTIRATLKDRDGSVIDLTNATSVKFLMRPIRGGTVVINAAAGFVNPRTSGQVEYLWALADTDAKGTYIGEFEVTWPDGKETFPNDEYILIRILEDIG